MPWLPANSSCSNFDLIEPLNSMRVKLSESGDSDVAWPSVVLKIVFLIKIQHEPNLDSIFIVGDGLHENRIEAVTVEILLQCLQVRDLLLLPRNYPNDRHSDICTHLWYTVCLGICARGLRSQTPRIVVPRIRVLGSYCFALRDWWKSGT